MCVHEMFMVQFSTRENDSMAERSAEVHSNKLSPNVKFRHKIVSEVVSFESADEVLTRAVF